jgi:excisionase family DNA binding protein
MPDTARFVSVATFAKLVSLSERTCWNLIRSRQIPIYRVGRRTLIRPDEGFQAIEKLGTEESTELREAE